ncbi:MAG: RloB domain-containing protein [Candidatus Nealsonbacteria bacterium]|nr:RloB domain-containing protein [Candidatus Nealsonbacteria bacterium]
MTREEKTYRDDRLFVIATEDTHAPDQYFRVFRNPRIKVQILPTKAGLSAPAHVLQRLEEFFREFDLQEDDELWLMLDTDHWIEPNHIASFHEVCSQATQKGFHLAHSNPCFEIWLLLHVADLDATEQFSRCQDVVQRLKHALGGYSKRSIDATQFCLEAVHVAVARAENLDESPDDRWPQKTGSHVYRVVKKLLQG